MKKTFRTVLAAVLALTMVFALSACGGGDVLKGTWTGEDPDYGAITWTFDGSGKCTNKDDLANQEGTYVIDGSQVTVTFEIFGEPSERVYDFKIDGDNLILDAVADYQLDYNLTRQ